jgi:hypothetical protein
VDGARNIGLMGGIGVIVGSPTPFGWACSAGLEARRVSLVGISGAGLSTLPFRRENLLFRHGRGDSPGNLNSGLSSFREGCGWAIARDNIFAASRVRGMCDMFKDIKFVF